MTNILTHPNYKDEYKVPLRFISEDRELKTLFNEKGEPINNNLNVKCESDAISFISTQTQIVYDSNEQRHRVHCIIKPIKSDTQDKVYFI